MKQLTSAGDWEEKLEEISVYANRQVTGYVIPIHEAKEFISSLLSSSLASYRDRVVEAVEKIETGQEEGRDWIKDSLVRVAKRSKEAILHAITEIPTEEA